VRKTSLFFVPLLHKPRTLAGGELMHMVRKDPLASGAEQALTAVDQFSAPAA
jgi:hypothetical protein